MSMSNLSRRSFVGLSGSAAAILGLGLVGCGGGSNSSDGAKAVSAEPQNGTPANTPLDKLPLPEKGKVYNNPQKRDNVKDGGTLVLPSGEIGPAWNYLSVDGNTQEMHNLWDFYMPTYIFLTDATASKFEPNPDFITEATTEMKDGKQVVHYKLNDKARFNDGTPIDYRAYKAVWTVMNGTDEHYTPAATDGYDRIESVERGDTDYDVVITMKNPVYPAELLFTYVLHPDATDYDKYNSFNNNPHSDDWGYGPYKIEIGRAHV